MFGKERKTESVIGIDCLNQTHQICYDRPGHSSLSDTSVLPAVSELTLIFHIPPLLYCSLHSEAFYNLLLLDCVSPLRQFSFTLRRNLF